MIKPAVENQAPVSTALPEQNVSKHSTASGDTPTHSEMSEKPLAHHKPTSIVDVATGVDKPKKHKRVARIAASEGSRPVKPAAGSGNPWSTLRHSYDDH